MQILFEARHAEALALRGLAVQRTRFVMRRLQALVPRARLQLEDVNGPRGGVDKRCRIELRPATGQPVVVSSTAVNWHRALNSALNRAVRALLRQLRKRARPATLLPH